jgi:hypothetical protein
MRPAATIGNNLVNRVEHAEPVLISDEVCLIGQGISLVADNLSALATHFHGGDVKRPNENGTDWQAVT